MYRSPITFTVSALHTVFESMFQETRMVWEFKLAEDKKHNMQTKAKIIPFNIIRDLCFDKVIESKIA